MVNDKKKNFFFMHFFHFKTFILNCLTVFFFSELRLEYKVFDDISFFFFFKYQSKRTVVVNRCCRLSIFIPFSSLSSYSTKKILFFYFFFLVIILYWRSTKKKKMNFSFLYTKSIITIYQNLYLNHMINGGKYLYSFWSWYHSNFITF